MSFSVGSAISSSSAARPRRFLARFGCGFGVAVGGVRRRRPPLRRLRRPDLEVLQVEVRLVYLEIIAGLGFEVVIALDLVCEVLVNGARFGRGGLLRAAAGGGASAVALAPRDDGRDLAAVAAFAGLAAVAFAGLVAVLDSGSPRLVLVARFAGADPLADFAAPAGLRPVPSSWRGSW